jgi:glutathione peroxidase
MPQPLTNIPVKRIDGSETTLEAFRGKVLLVVNVASKCGLTPQYTALEKLYEDRRGEGLEILAFPANDFGAQEPGTNEEISTFCSTNYNVTFPLFSKISVKGAGEHPLYSALTSAQPSATDPGGGVFKKKLEGYGVKQEKPSDVLWNFEKFVIGRDGQVIARFSPDTPPDHPQLKAVLDAALAKH